MSEEKDRSCYNCRFYKAYYTKGYYKFDRCDYGLCAYTKMQVKKCDGCQYFSWQHYFRQDRKTLALRMICENIDVLSQIKQILEDDKE